MPATGVSPPAYKFVVPQGIIRFTMRRMDTTSSDSNAIDLFIKYGAAVGAVIYGLGFLEENELLQRIGIPGDFAFADPRYFIVGAYLLVLSMMSVPILFATRDWFHSILPEEEPGFLISNAVVVCFVFTFGSIFAVALKEYHAWIRDALLVSAAGAAANSMSVFEIRRMRNRSRPGLWEQVYPLFIVAIALAAFAKGAGKIHWRYVLAQQGHQQVRLLVEENAVRGVQEMGLTFPELRPGEKSAELSGPVEVIFESENTYVLRLNGQVARVGKGKVLGSVP
jgi:hypothetical protein